MINRPKAAIHFLLTDYKLNGQDFHKVAETLTVGPEPSNDFYVDHVREGLPNNATIVQIIEPVGLANMEEAQAFADYGQHIEKIKEIHLRYFDQDIVNADAMELRAAMFK